MAQGHYVQPQMAERLPQYQQGIAGLLAAYGIPDDRADSAIRVSFSGETEPEMLEALLSAVRDGQRTLIHK